LKRLPDGGRAFLTRFADRMLFARDQFDDVLYEHLKSLRLKPAVWRKIASENALRLVPLPRRRR
jgi:predicted TIM-barrel fold metal-dependent hydrolase